ncbi:unnamed protein product [Moneuplotes crassus]|uniref:Calmodulin n=1 Tax=Euplotes crassus TaxID=5936 RepID=A0AAD1XQS9_EUPCR|nr:unnamed protein product [Moneuplotes crassus]CAI2377366.1 unnamed protein product [Moneuplotes crassus]
MITIEDLSETQLEEFKEAFSLFDKDGDGTVDTNELGQVMRTLGQNPTEAELNEMIQEVDVDGNGEIDFEEFVGLMAKKLNEEDTQEEFVEVFEIFDKDGDDRINQKDLFATLKEMGETVTEADVRDMIEEHGEGNNFLTFEGFIKMMMAK